MMLGRAWKDLADTKKAIHYYQKLLDLLREALGKDHPATQEIEEKIDSLKQH